MRCQIISFRWLLEMYLSVFRSRSVRYINLKPYTENVSDIFIEILLTEFKIIYFWVLKNVLNIQKFLQISPQQFHLNFVLCNYINFFSSAWTRIEMRSGNGAGLVAMECPLMERHVSQRPTMATSKVMGPRVDAEEQLKSWC